jgi:hypothetical protein
MDGYNWGPSATRGSQWTEFDSLFRGTYAALTRLSPARPIMVAETASTERGGSKSSWISTALAQLPGAFPAVRGIVWFDWGVGGMDWPLESSSGATAAFSVGIASPLYAGASFGGLLPVGN